ncbi:hypothetical protein FW755_01290 [Lonepinella koalarum]|uniref:hypothetical protein n=1 Tax=Lonepinella TaxID=53416 RepID=UPI0011E4942B|nr:hypothetical protein [Lonepinella koalarum]TYG33818.1 hypothetical protein FW755_01290 [Lonepinella koalarum]
MNLCDKQHRYASALECLPHNQGGEARHKCSGCAFEAGLLDGLNQATKIDPAVDNRVLYSQAGTGRHKDIYTAYELGYLQGTELFNGKNK